MVVDIVVPPLSQTMDTVVLVEWLKDVGDEVVKGESLFSIETEKAIMEVESPGSGILQKILAAPGEEVEVGSKIGLLAPDGADSEEPDIEIATGVSATQPSEVTAAPTPYPPSAATARGDELLPPERHGRILASPRARHLAQQQGISWAGLIGTGPEQMITERDVRAYLEKQAAGRATRADRSVTLSPTRRTIAHRMSQSHQTTAPVTLTREVDATELVRLREQALEKLPDDDPRPTYTDLLISIVARCLRRHPRLNASTDGEAITLHEQVHIALAVDTERGLLVPVIRDADRKELVELARERTDLVRRAIAGTVTPEEFAGATFTITNLGGLGVDAFTPIINVPQVAILGVGRIRPKPAVHQGELCVRHLMHLSLTFDHRVVDGAPAARFLQDLAQSIEQPDLTIP